MATLSSPIPTPSTRNRSRTMRPSRLRPARRPRRRISCEALEDRTLLAVTVTGVPSYQTEGPGPIAGSEYSSVGNSGVGGSAIEGSIDAIAVDPTNPSVTYIGSVNGGVWRTNDVHAVDQGGHDEWTPLTDQLPGLSINSLNFLPGTSVLYAGIGDNSSFNDDGGAMTGVLRTTDGGQTWTQLGKQAYSQTVNPDGKTMQPGGLAGLAVRQILPTDLNTATTVNTQTNLLGTQIVLAGTNQGLFLSVDGGQTWTDESDRPGNGVPKADGSPSVGLLPGDITDLVLAHSVVGNGDVVYAAVPHKGVFRATLAASTPGPSGNPVETLQLPLQWIPTDNTDARGLQGVPLPAFDGYSNNLTDIPSTVHIDLSVHDGPDGDEVYAAIVEPDAGFQTKMKARHAGNDQNYFYGIFRSLDQGVTWQYMGIPSDQFGPVDMGGQMDQQGSIVADPNSLDVVYVGGDLKAGSVPVGPVSIPISPDGNIMKGVYDPTYRVAHWEALTGYDNLAGLPIDPVNGYPHSDNRTLVMSGGYLIDGCDGGIYGLDLSHLGGSVLNEPQWMSYNGNLFINEQFSVAYDNNHDVILAGSQDNGTNIQTGDGQLQWQEISTGLLGSIYSNNFEGGGGDGGYVYAKDALDYQRYWYENDFQNNGFIYQYTILPVVNSNEQLPMQVVGPSGTSSSLAAYEAGLGQTLPFFAPFKVDGAGNNVRLILATKTNLYESFDGGNTCTQLVGQTPDGKPLNLGAGMLNDSGPGTVLVYGGRIDSAGNPDLIIDGAGSNLFLRQEFGKPLVQIASYPGSAIRGIVTDRYHWNSVFVVDSNANVWFDLDIRDPTQKWQNLTFNLNKLTSDPRCIEEVTAQDGSEHIFIGGGKPAMNGLVPQPGAASGGIYQLLTVNGQSSWVKFGANLPNALVSSMVYDFTTDALIVGTFGRGSFMIHNIGSQVGIPSVMQITGDNNSSHPNNQFTLEADPNNPLLLDVIVNNTLQKSIPWTALYQVSVTGGAGDDTLTVDFRNGVFSFPGGLSFDGGSNHSGTLEVFAQNATSSTTVYQPAFVDSGTIVVDGTPITFTNLAPVIAHHASEFTLTTPNSNNNLTLDSPGPGQLRISGDSGGTGFENATVDTTGSVVLNTKTNDFANESDTLTVTAATLADVPDLNLTFQPGSNAASNHLYLDAQGNDITITHTTIAVVGSQPLTFSNLGTIELTNPGNITVGDDQDNEQLVVNATGVASGNLRLDGGPIVNFNRLTSLRYLTSGDATSLIIDNPNATLFAPAGGISVQMSHRDGLVLLENGGGALFAETVTAFPGAGNANIAFDGAASVTYALSGVGGVLDVVPVGAYTVQGTHGSDTIRLLEAIVAGYDRLTLNDALSIDFRHKLTLVLDGGTNAGDTGNLIELNYQTPAADLTAVSIHGGTGNDTVRVRSAPVHLMHTIYSDDRNIVVTVDPTGPATTTSGGTGNDIVVQSNGNQNLVDAGFGDDTVTVHATAGPTTIVGGQGNDTITLESTGAATTIRGGQGSDTINVQSIGGSTSISGGRGNDTINVGSQAPNLRSILFGIAAPLSIQCIASMNALNVDDTGTLGSRTGTLTSGSLTGLNMASGITYAGIQALTVRLGAGSNDFTIQGTAAGTTTVYGGQAENAFEVQSIGGPTSVYGGYGIDTFNLGSLAPGAGGTIDPIAASLLVVGGTSSRPNIMDVDDTGSTRSKAGTLTATTLTGLGMAVGVTYNNIQAVNIRLGSGGNVFNVLSTDAGQTFLDSGTESDTVNIQSTSGPTTVQGNDGNDAFNVGSLAPATSGVVDLVAGPLSVDGGTGSNVLNVDDTGSTSARTGTLTSGTLTGLAMAGGVTYLDINSMNVRLGSGNDVFTIASTHANSTLVSAVAGNNTFNVQAIAGNTLVRGGTGNDTFIVGSTSAATARAVRTIPAPLMLDGGGGTNQVSVAADVDFTLRDWNLQLSTGDSFGLRSMQQAVLTGGPTDNTFDVSAWAGTGTLNGGGGLDRVVSVSNADGVLTDTGLSRSNGTSFVLNGIGAAELGGGSRNNTLDATGFFGAAWLYGGTGNDTLRAGSGSDYLDGGSGHDCLVGGTGSDILVGLSGTGDTIQAGSGDATIYGSSFADTLLGGTGSNVIDGRGGNDLIVGGPGNDCLWGGTGNDTIYGGGGNDLILGVGSDVIYDGAPGSNSTGGVDTIYGSGSDVIHAGPGNDTIFDQGGTNVIDGGGPGTQILRVGLGSIQPPASSPVPIPPNWPPSSTSAASTLPTGPTSGGRWGELAGSASGGGLSNGPGQAIESSIAAGSTGPYVAWADSRSGQFAIDVARYTGTGWQELAGSAEANGISGPVLSARQPSLTLDQNGNPVVAWVANAGAGDDIAVARYDPAANGNQGGWVSLGNSLAPGGISGDGLAAQPDIVETPLGPVVAWLDGSSGTTSVYAKVFSGGTWNALGMGAASGSGISNGSLGIQDLALAADGAQVDVAWTAALGPRTQVDLLEFNGTSWQQLAGSVSVGGISHSTANASAPSLAYLGGTLFAAWQDSASGSDQIVAARYVNGSWQSAGAVSHSPGGAMQPVLAAGGGQLELAWVDHGFAGLPDNAAALFAVLWNGSTFLEEVPGDARAGGIGGSLGSAQAPALTVDASGHPFVSWSDTSSGRPQIDVRGNPFDLGTIHYVNGACTASDSVCTASGSDANDGLSPTTPKATLAGVLNDTAHPLHTGDVIIVDSGVYSDPVDFSTAAAGIVVIGSTSATTTISGPIVGNNVTGLTLSGLTLTGAVTLNSATATTLSGDVLNGPGLTLTGGTGVDVVHDGITSYATGITLGGGITNVTIGQDTIAAAAQDIVVTSNVSGLDVEANRLGGTGYGIVLSAPASGHIAGNEIVVPATGLSINSAFTGTIERNDFRGAYLGVSYQAAAALVDNRIHDNTTGLASGVANPASALGFVEADRPNQIFDNMTGVALNAALMQGQHVFANDVGVTGTGLLVAIDLDHANVIEANSVGINFNGPIEFERIARGGVGIIASSGQLIAHDVIDRTAAVGIHVTGQAGVQIINDTLYSPTGDLVAIDGGASGTELHNNVFWARGGYDINVADNSQTGFFSDYNDLHSDGAGKLVHWDIDFTDVLDWQADVDAYDLHSIGRTAVNPRWSQPRFLALGLDDYRIADPWAGLRPSSPTVAAADPLTDLGQPTSTLNLLANPGFEQGLTGWGTNPTATARASNPAPFAGSGYFSSGSTQVGFATQTADPIALAGVTAAQIDSGTLYAVFGGRVRSAATSPVDQGLITLTFLDASQKEISHDTINAQNLTDRWELLGARITIPAGTRSLTYRFEADRRSSGDDQSFLDGAFLQVVANTVAPDQGAYGDTAPQLVQAPAAHLALRSPDLYTDWERTVSHTIRWDPYNAGKSAVRIDIYQDTANGPVLLANITPAAPDTGTYAWAPIESGIDYGTYGLRIQVSLVGSPSAFDRSTETFAVPENTNTFYVNDASLENDDPGLGTAVGSNRNTGKIPSTPKPFPNNVLRTYSLGAGQTLYVNTGSYALLSPILLSSTVGLGDDAGFTLTGPADPTKVAAFSFANPLTVAPLVELNNASFTTISHLTFQNAQKGLWAHDNSTNLTASYLTAAGMASDGFRIEAGSDGSILSHLTATNNGGAGINVLGPIAGLDHSLASGNAQSGILLGNAGPTIVAANEASFNGGYGILAGNTATSPMTVGTSDLTGNGNTATAGGNVVHDNAQGGINASGHVQVAGNTVYNQTRPGAAGIVLSGNSAAQDNVVHDNDTGIIAFSADLITGNRVYHNTQTGVRAIFGSTLQQNVVYSNGTGIQADPFSGYPGSLTLTNNLIYANSTVGLVIYAGSSVDAINNTIVQPNGDAVHALSGTSGLHLRNNILWTQAGAAIDVASDSQSGFTSDNNLLYATGAGTIGTWQGVARGTLAAWQSATVQDANSLSTDPVFVNPAGVDGILGYGGPANDGRDDDFHPQSEQGSVHGGALAPVASTATGLPVASAATLTPDSNESPTIDRGAETDPYSNEPAPNGGFVNLGNYGNSAQAALSPTSYLLLLKPDGGEVWPEGQTFPIRWRTQDLSTGGSSSTVTITLLQKQDGGGPATVLTIATAAPNTGELDWTVPITLTPGSTYLIQVTRDDNGNPSDASLEPFTIAAQSHLFYVNDGSVQAGDWTTAPGNDANDGLTPTWPKATIQAVLQAYHLGQGDIIKVDAGTYNLTANVTISAASSGVTIQGFNDPSYPTRHAVISRGSTNNGADDFDLSGGQNVTLDHLFVTGAFVGINGLSGAKSTGLVITNCEVYGNAYYGVQLQSTTDNAIINGNSIHDNSGSAGLYVWTAAGAQVTGNQFANNQGANVDGSQAANTVVANNDSSGSTTGIYFDGSGSIIRNNTVHDATGTDIAAGNYYTGGAAVIGNTAWNAPTGISANYTTVSGNTVFANTTGLYALGTPVLNNVAYDNSGDGIEAEKATTVSGNRSYSNAVGIHGFGAANQVGSGPYIINNLVDGNASAGILFDGGNSPTLLNNTVYQLSGNAVRIQGNLANLQVENNILWTQNGHDLSVDPASESGFSSDYNDLYTTGAGVPVQWENQNFMTLADWSYELAFDSHSIAADPRFVNPAGPDGIEGFSTQATGAAQILDDSGSGVATSGSWTKVAGSGYGKEYLSAGGFNVSAQDTYTFTGLAPGRFYQVAATWPAGFGGATSNALFTVQDGSNPPVSMHVNQQNNPSDFSDQGVSWKMLGTFYETSGTLTVAIVKQDQFTIAADAVRLQPIVGNAGADDDFHLQAGSPAVDAGDPAFSFINEPLPNGERIDLGRYGNTAEATASPLQSVSVLAPTALTKVQAGRTTTIAWHATGITPTTYYPGLVLANNPVSYYRLGDAPGSVTAADSSGHGHTATYQGGVALGVPPRRGSDGTTAAMLDGNSGYVSLAPTGLDNLSNGFTVDMWVYPTTVASWQRFIDFGNGPSSDNILLARYGTSNDLWFQVFSNSSGGGAVDASNAIQLNVWQEFTATVTSSGQATIYKNGTAIASANINVPSNVTRANDYIGRSNWPGDPTFGGAIGDVAIYNQALTAAQVGSHQSVFGTSAIDLLPNGDPTQAVPVAAAAPNGQPFTWSVPTNLVPGNYVIRITSNDGNHPLGLTSGLFQVAEAGHDFYVNDDSTTGDVFTTAPGNNANSGKSPAHPMASLQALLNAYTFSPGDVIHVDTGTYVEFHNVVVPAQDSGVTIQGPNTAVALFNRNNNSGGTAVFQLAGASNVLIDHLSLTGGQYGFEASDQGGTNLTISNCDIFGNHEGIMVAGYSVSNVLITGDRIHDNDYTAYARGTGVDVSYGTNDQVVGNTIFDNGWDITLASANGLVANNIVYNAGDGIDAGNTANGGSTIVSGNLVHDVTTGISAGGVLVQNNEIYNALGGTGVGISLNGGTARGNYVHDNALGISGSNGLVDGNRITNNQGTGLNAYNGLTARNNTISGNALGLGAYNSSNNANLGPYLDHNLIYLNRTAGVEISGGDYTPFVNNTVVQSAGYALYVHGPGINITLENNILETSASGAYALQVTLDSVPGLRSDYNDLVATGGARLAQWIGTDALTLASWYYASGLDQHSISADPRFVNSAGGNYQLQSGAPAVDAGDPSSAYANEPAPNGSRIDLGAYGNTALATPSAPQSLQVLAPAQFGRVQAGRTATITWLVSGITPVLGTSEIDLLPSGDPTQAVPVATTAPNAQPFTWNVPAALAPGTYTLRITSNDATHPSGMSTPFLVAEAGHDFYVNDGSTADDVLTTAPGDDSASGKSPAHPVVSLPALLQAYAFSPGDVIHVDTGNYVLLRPIVLGPAYSRVTFQGPANAVATINRNLNTAGASDFELNGATDVTIDHLSLTGAYNGIQTDANSNSDRLTISNDVIFGQYASGISIPYGSADVRILNNTVRNNPNIWGAGMTLNAVRTLVQGNLLFANFDGISASLNQSGSTANQIVVQNNTIHDNGRFGIIAGSFTLVTNNTVYGQSVPNPPNTGTGASVGIYETGGTVQNNVVYNNTQGINSGGYVSAPIQGNRVYGNSTGIADYDNTPVLGNFIYDNGIGIATGGGFGILENNLIYANTNDGLIISGSSDSRRLFANNTIDQNVGDAVLIEGSSSNVRLLNNILRVQAGYDLYVANDSHGGFSSNNNLFALGTSAAHLGYWSGDVNALAAWQGATGGDALSVTGDPKFVDPAGADNVLGYTSSSGGYDGGRDDNYALAAGSPAIDHGDMWLAPPTDLAGNPRIDDPGTPNQGGPDYVASSTTGTVFSPTTAGTAQAWHADDAFWTLNLPFAFPFYGTSYTSVLVSSNGFLQFSGADSAADPNPSDSALLGDGRIAPLWADLRTDTAGSDIFVDASIANQVGIRWQATSKTSGSPVNVAVELFSDGHFRFDYGAGNTGLSPTIGVSRGDGTTATYSAYDGRVSLTDAASTVWMPQTGYAAKDLGTQTFPSGGVAQGWHADEGVWSLNLPFAFPFYGKTYTSAIVSSNGFLQFAGPNTGADYINTNSELIANARIAPLWQDLFTNTSGSDIYVDTSVSGQIVVRWQATGGSGRVNVAVTLYSDGRIRFDYGSGNSGLSPTVGISAGDGVNYLIIAGYDRQSTLTNAHSLLIAKPAIPPYAEAPQTQDNFYQWVGTAQNWRSDDGYWNLNLPFAFPFYGTSYTNVSVSSNGLLQFSGSDAPNDPNHSDSRLLADVRIAPLWTDLRTDQPGNDIFVSTSVTGQVTIRWNATNKADDGIVNFAVTILNDGRIRYDYGPMTSTNVGATVGLSAGNGLLGQLSTYDGRLNLTDAPSVLWTLQPGFVDIGAYEFQGNSLNTTPPAITATTPAAVASGGVTGLSVNQIVVNVSEPLNGIDATAPANYELRGAGADGQFETLDDVIFVLTPAYTPGGTQVTLGFPTPSGGLPPGLYRLTVYSTPTHGLHDLTGLELDGLGNGVPGSGSYVRTFTINAPAVLASPTSGLTTNGDGGTASYNVVLGAQPTASVTVGLSSSDTQEGTVAPSSLVFTPANWNVPQTVTITGQDDRLNDGDVPYTIQFDPADSTDSRYNGLTGPTVSVVNENEDWTITGVVAEAANPRNTAEDAVDVTFTHAINTSTFSPSAVSLTLNGTTVTVPTSLTLTPIAGTTYRLSGLSSATAAQGQYTLKFDATQVQDTAGLAGLGTASDSWLMDTSAPSSQVQALAATQANTSFPVTMTGTDPNVASGVPGSGIALFELLVSTDGGAFVPYGSVPAGAPDGSGVYAATVTFLGAAGHIYGFQSIATDAVGNVESKPPGAEATTSTMSPLTVASVVPEGANPRNTAEDAVDVTFSQSINTASFTSSAVGLTLDGSPVAVPSSLTIALVSGTTYRVAGLVGATGAEGQYALTFDATQVQNTSGQAGQGSASTSWLMDTSPPSSHVQALATSQTTTSFPVTITGSDPALAAGVPGSGIASFMLFVSTDGGAFAPYSSTPAGTPNGSGVHSATVTFTGPAGHKYGFLSTATDAAGNVEVKTPKADTTTYVRDLSPPTTEVTAVTTSTPHFQVSYQGTDPDGPDIASFTLWVAVDGGTPLAFATLPAGAPSATYVYSGKTTYAAIADGQTHTYRFYSTGKDKAGNVQPAPSDPNANVVVTARFAAATLKPTMLSVQQGSAGRSFLEYLDLGFNQSTQTLQNLIANNRIEIIQHALTGPAAGDQPISLSGVSLTAVDQVIEFDFGKYGIGSVAGAQNSTAWDGYYEIDVDYLGNGKFAPAAFFYRLLGDVDGNHAVDSVDLSKITANLGRVGTNLPTDVNGDGTVNATDRQLALQSQGRKLASGLKLGIV
jgi:hypothetical protein